MVRSKFRKAHDPDLVDNVYARYRIVGELLVDGTILSAGIMADPGLANVNVPFGVAAAAYAMRDYNSRASGRQQADFLCHTIDLNDERNLPTLTAIKETMKNLIRG
jgi:hypothetical protein